ncbi:hypothetical protein AMJ39_05265 [candidate division TA06 bacterium DG_24]|uniref:Periplasmic copper-binding protein NosD beta helix domain-containing protein n=2 Tax=Bacteria division TA06 TaxID=1156500 RepID=A0A0S8GAR9_UNCT6|nr:MAG: hypothetical protein AMJ39_05265 [candidate division TA06 bacterium DG_24]KPK69777.1 MAG: hypothetical protein AMJ82_04880 [candidate division TA06 bacterium SM23_40]
MRRMILLLCGSLVLGYALSVWATVLRVPGEYPTIQAGINAAVDNDTVLVADGTYSGDGNRDLDFGGVNMVVMSENGPEVTIIDCEGSAADPHRGFVFHSGEDASSVVQGLTITNGHIEVYDGGGIYCLGSSPSIEGNIITGNSAAYNGGGIFCDGASAAIIRANIVAGNTSTYSGSGICCIDSWPTIQGNTITANTAHHSGGGLCVYHLSAPTIEGNTITGNTADFYGGGVFYDYTCSGVIRLNTISGNTAAFTGGGMYCSDSSPIAERNTIVENTADEGGGIYCYYHAMPVIKANTVTANRAALGGGICCYWACSPIVFNTVLWADSAATDQEIYVDETSSIDVTYCDVEGGWQGAGNIEADPLFLLADKNDYRLLWGSPCVDSGDPDYTDPDGTRSDMGAHFFDQDDYLTLYLTPDTLEVTRGGVLGVTYTAINRWAQPEPFWVLTEATLPNGNPFPVMGPAHYALPANHTEQRHLNHIVPGAAPLGLYGYGSRIGVPPSTLYDEDSFAFIVVGP